MPKQKNIKTALFPSLRSKISYKLFGAFFLILLIMAGGWLLPRYFLVRNMQAFIEKLEAARFIRIVAMVEDEYAARNGWQGIGEDKAFLERLFRQEKKVWAQLSRLKKWGRTRQEPLGWPIWPIDIFLLDVDRRPIVGCPEPGDEKTLQVIEVDGKTVGWVGQHQEPFEEGLVGSLIEGQNRQIYVLYVAVMLAAGGVALLLSRHLLKPIRKLIEGTRQLANRDFSVRIEILTNDELGQLASHFNVMAETLEAYENTHRLWLTDISHDLRTPLTVLKVEIEALQDGIREVNSERLASLQGEIARLGKLVEDLHLSFLMESDSLQLNTKVINPFAVMKTITEGYDRLLSSRQIDLLLEIEALKTVSMEGDVGRLTQVFSNIFDNAYHYIQPPGVLKVSGRIDNSFCTLLFQDSGPGVLEDEYPRLFDRYFRASRKDGGSGLGLFICRRIVEQHGGGIWAEKSPLGGLTIGIRLPVL